MTPSCSVKLQPPRNLCLLSWIAIPLQRFTLDKDTTSWLQTFSIEVSSTAALEVELPLGVEIGGADDVTGVLPVMRVLHLLLSPFPHCEPIILLMCMSRILAPIVIAFIGMIRKLCSFIITQAPSPGVFSKPLHTLLENVSLMTTLGTLRHSEHPNLQLIIERLQHRTLTQFSIANSHL